MRLLPAGELGTVDAAELIDAADPLIVLDLDAGVPDRVPDALPGAVLVGVARAPLSPGVADFATGLDCTLTTSPAPRWAVTVPDVDAAITHLIASVAAAPRAAATLATLLRLSPGAAVADGLLAESLAYSMLLAGPEFARWQQARPTRQIPPASAPPVLLDRIGDRLDITLNRPERRNAFGRQVRDALVEAFDLVAADESIAQVHLRGAGPGFCSGGDLDEFGTTPDVVSAHLIRSQRSVAARIHRVRERVHVHLHGACIGAGIELPSFAGWVGARPDTAIRLPELGLGLIPGAGGTVGVAARIGRWRCAYLALTGTEIDARTAHTWGLVDEITDDD
jgi:hypothetical protein